MTPKQRLPKSYLFVPGDSEKKQAKAPNSGAQALILCLEDAVAEANKSRARQMVAQWLHAHRDRTQQVWVRINALDTPHALADLVAVLPAKPDGIFLPKPSGAEDFRMLDHYLTALEAQNGLELGGLRVMSIVESALGALNSRDFPGATPRLVALTWGPEDLSADVGAMTNRDEQGVFFLIHQMNRANLLLLAAAAQAQAVDTLYANFRDGERLRAECIRARKEGFTGKLAIHPDQVPIINECFTPTDEEVAHARRVLAAFAAAGTGAVQLDGKMLDRPHAKQAQRIVDQSS
jgi:citrate lyase subunit beta/citryl-CoA lyase